MKGIELASTAGRINDDYDSNDDVADEESLSASEERTLIRTGNELTSKFASETPAKVKRHRYCCFGWVALFLLLLKLLFEEIPQAAATLELKIDIEAEAEGKEESKAKYNMSYPDYVIAAMGEDVTSFQNIPELKTAINRAKNKPNKNVVDDDSVQVAVFGGSYTTGVGWDEGNDENKAHYSDPSLRCSFSENCLPSSWAGRLQDKLDEHYGIGIFRVVNLAVSASCSGCISGMYSSLVKGGKLAESELDTVLEIGRIDLVLMDYSVNDANTNRNNGGVFSQKDNRYGIMAGLEQLVLRLKRCGYHGKGDRNFFSRPAFFFIQVPPISWTPGKASQYPSSLPVFQMVAEKYNSIYLDMNDLADSFLMVRTAHWPHPDSEVHEIQAAYLFDVIKFVDEAEAEVEVEAEAEAEAEGENGEGEEDATCNNTPLTTAAEREIFQGCDITQASMFGVDPANWDVVHADAGWSLSHDDVPSRPDKTGYLYQSDAPGANFEAGAKISFRIKLGSQKLMTMDYLRTYEHAGYAICYLEGTVRAVSEAKRSRLVVSKRASKASEVFEQP